MESKSLLEQIDSALYQHGEDLTDAQHIKLRQAILSAVREMVDRAGPKSSLGNYSPSVGGTGPSWEDRAYNNGVTTFK